MKRRVNTAPTTVIDVCDWTQHERDASIVFIPSMRTAARQLKVTLLAALVVAGMWWFWGIPPGSATLATERREIEQLSDQIDQLESRSRRMSTSAGPTGQRMSEQQAEQARRLRAERDRRAAALSQATPSLGPVGDSVFWSVVTVCVLVGVGLPVLCLVVRTELAVEGEAIVVRRRLGRTRRFPVAPIVGAKPLAQRIRTGNASDASRPRLDHGWLWELRVIADRDAALPPGLPRARSLTLRIELHSMLPAGDNLPAGVKRVARLLQERAGISCSPATTVDAGHPPAWGFGRRRISVHDAETIDLSRKPPLDRSIRSVDR